MKLRKPQAVTPDATPDALLARLRAIDEACIASGMPGMHAWWWRTVRRFLRSGKLTLTVRKGRRVGASSIVAPRLAVVFALALAHRVPRGEVGIVAFISVKRGEAQNRLRNTAAVLDAIGVRYTKTADAIELAELPVVIRVLTANYRTVVGELTLFAWCDEVSRWRDDAAGENPAHEIISSLKPSLATVPEARLFLISSPLSTTDYHAKAFDRGDDAEQMVVRCTSWEAGPLTEADTRRLESDPRVWSREWAAEPQASVSAAFPDGIDHVVSWGVRQRPYERGVEYIVLCDPGGASSTGRSETAVIAAHVEYRQRASGDPVLKTLVIDCARVLRRTWLRAVRFDDIVRAIVEVCREYHVTRTISDIHLHAALQPALLQHGITLDRAEMTLPVQAQRSATLISHVQASSIDVLDHADLTKQMREAVLRERGSHFIITRPDKSGAKDDLIDCLLLACERQAIVKASGGSVRYLPPRIVHTGGGHVHLAREGRYFREAPDGTRLPVETPRNDRSFERQRRERWTQGITTPADHAEFPNPGELEQAMRDAFADGEPVTAEPEPVWPLDPVIARALNR